MKRQWVNDYIVDDISALDPTTLDAYTSLMLTATTYGYIAKSLSKPA